MNGFTRGLACMALPLLLAACGNDDKHDPPAVTVDSLLDAGLTSPGTCTVLEPTCAVTQVPSFQNDVTPIINASCASLPGCHTGKAGDPWPLNDYTEIVDWSETFIIDLQDCTMPPADAGVTLTPRDRLILWQWLNCGTPKN